MFTSIRHIAVMTENWNREARFYQTIFGMKKITNGSTNPDRGHISDGVIGMAILGRRCGLNAGFDHFGFEVDDADAIVAKIKQFD